MWSAIVLASGVQGGKAKPTDAVVVALAIAPLVELEWKQYDEEPGRVAIARRVWARTIPEALQIMIDDRRTDLTLEEIEAAAEEGGDSLWDDGPRQ
jgi:hypothetical protein